MRRDRKTEQAAKDQRAEHRVIPHHQSAREFVLCRYEQCMAIGDRRLQSSS